MTEKVKRVRKKRAVKELAPKASGFVFGAIVMYLKKDKKRAQDLVAAAYPGEHIHKNPAFEKREKKALKEIQGELPLE